MDKKNKIFFAVFFTLVAAVVTITFVKYFVAKDYYIEAQADCDPYVQNCVVWECDPDSTEDGEKCTGDPEEDIWYYQNVKKIASEIPLCDPNGEDCDALACDAGMDCEVTYCDEATAEEGTTCNDPVKYTQENPVEEECAEGDEECLAAEEEECAPDDEECSSEEDAGGEENADDGSVQKEKGDSGGDDEKFSINDGSFMD